MKGGNSMFTNDFNRLVIDLNEFWKEMLSGQYIQATATSAHQAQAIIALRDAVSAEIAARDTTIAQLKARLRQAGVEVVDIDEKGKAAE
jgi:uncharacterized protein YceH (UPF0502 family)